MPVGNLRFTGLPAEEDLAARTNRPKIDEAFKRLHLYAEGEQVIELLANLSQQCLSLPLDRRGLRAAPRTRLQLARELPGAFDPSAQLSKGALEERNQPLRLRYVKATHSQIIMQPGAQWSSGQCFFRCGVDNLFGLFTHEPDRGGGDPRIWALAGVAAGNDFSSPLLDGFGHWLEAKLREPSGDPAIENATTFIDRSAVANPNIVVAEHPAPLRLEVNAHWVETLPPGSAQYLNSICQVLSEAVALPHLVKERGKPWIRVDARIGWTLQLGFAAQPLPQVKCKSRKPTHGLVLGGGRALE